MRYWAIGRGLGLSEAEFWLATYAEIAALYHVKVLQWEKRRDYFVAQNIAIQVNTKEKSYTAEEILESCYPKMLEAPQPEVDPDLGAQGDWQSLRQHLKGDDGS